MVKCDVCDQEFDTEPELDKHMAEMHSSDQKPEMPGAEEPNEFEEPDFKPAVSE